MTLHQAITREQGDEFDRVFLEAAPIVRTLADERRKPWPRLGVVRDRHEARIADLNSELRRVAAKIGWNENELEQFVRAEMERRGRRVPKVAPVPIRASKELLDAEFAVETVRQIVANTERLIAMHQRNLVKQQIDLSRKREAAQIMREKETAK